MVILSGWADIDSEEEAFDNLNNGGLIPSDHFTLSEIEPLNSPFEKHYKTLERTSLESRAFLYENYLGLRVTSSATSVFQANSDTSDDEAYALPQIHGYIDVKRDTLVLFDAEVDQISSTGARLDLSRIQSLALSMGGQGSTFETARNVLRFLEHRTEPLNLTVFINTSGSNFLTLGYRYKRPTPHFIEIDNKFTEIVPENFAGFRTYTQSQRERQIQTVTAKAEKFRKEFEFLTEKYKDRFSGIKLRVCLLGWIFSVESELRIKDRLYSPPKQPKSNDVLFYTNPSAGQPISQTQFKMRVNEIGLWFACSEDGSPVGKYDEYTGLSRLFEEE
jgi:hypothetical protein